MLKSLLILGHPKGMTSTTFDLCCCAVKGLRSPIVSSGEVLNWQRNSDAPRRDFYSAGLSPVYESLLLKYKSGFVVKDVIQPLACVDILRANPGAFNVLYVHRCPYDVRAHQVMQGWSSHPHPITFVAQLREICDIEIPFHDLTTNESCLPDVLEDEFEYEVDRLHYLDARFQRTTLATRIRLNDYYLKYPDRRKPKKEGSSVNV